MLAEPYVVGEKPRLRALLEHFAAIEDPREPWRVAYPLPEILLLVVCGTIADCDDYEGIAEWGEAHLPFLRRFLPYHHEVPGARWLTILMNRIDPGLCARDLARPAGGGGDRRQDLPPQPRPRRRAGSAPPRLGLRDHHAPGARPGGGGRQDERDHGDPGAPRAARRQGRPQGSARHHRRHRHQPDHRGRRARRRRRLPPRRQGQPARPARRDRSLLRRSPRRRPRHRD